MSENDWLRAAVAFAIAVPFILAFYQTWRVRRFRWGRNFHRHRNIVYDFPGMDDPQYWGSRFEKEK